MIPIYEKRFTKKQSKYLRDLESIQGLAEAAYAYKQDTDAYAVCFGIIYPNGDSIIDVPVFVAEDDKECKALCTSYRYHKGVNYPESKIRFFII